MDYADRDELKACLHHLLDTFGNAALMTEPLIDTLCDHAAGNYRALITMAAELLAIAVKEEKKQLDEALFLQVFTPPTSKKRKKL